MERLPWHSHGPSEQYRTPALYKQHAHDLPPEPACSGTCPSPRLLQASERRENVRGPDTIGVLSPCASLPEMKRREALNCDGCEQPLRLLRPT